MSKKQELFSKSICFILKSGKEIYPVKIKRRETGNIAFRISVGGKSGNTVKVSEEVNEETMITKVLHDGYAVRCSSLDGEINGLYKPGHQAIAQVRKSL